MRAGRLAWYPFDMDPELPPTRISSRHQRLQDQISAEREAPPKRELAKRGRSQKKQRWHWLISAIILVLGGAALGWAIVLFPSEDTITGPPGYQIQVDTLGHQLSVVNLEFIRGTGHTITIAAWVGGSGSSDEEAVIVIWLHGHVTLVGCSHPITLPDCSDMGKVDNYWTEVDLPVPNGLTRESEVIRDPSFGFTENSQTVYAELPSIYASQTQRSFTSFSISYNIPNASMYDWSVPPQVTDYGPPDTTIWNYELNLPTQNDAPFGTFGSQVAQGTEVIGLNHDAQTADSTDTLIAGALLGIAGGAAIVAMQEVLHIIVGRQDELAE
jgi:hypothetical protein